MPLDPEFVALLAHPTHPDHPPLAERHLADGREILFCEATGEGFPIVDGIPQLLPDSAIPAHELQSLSGESV